MENYSQQIQLEALYESKKKSTFLAYVLWFFLNAHYAYLGKWGIQIGYWFTYLLAVFGIIGTFGIQTESGMIGAFVVIAPYAVWWFINLFSIAGMVNYHNGKLKMTLAKQLGVLQNPK